VKRCDINMGEGTMVLLCRLGLLLVEKEPVVTTFKGLAV
jgi:hypothetical protein